MRYNSNVKTLLEIPVGSRARLVHIDNSLHKKLLQYGLHAGDGLRVLRVAPLGGPILVEVNGREIALGRTVAKKILVEAE